MPSGGTVALGPGVIMAEAVRDESVAKEDALKGENGATKYGFDNSRPAVKPPIGHPPLHGSDLQQPIKGGLVAAHTYQRLPDEHS